jgi:hypothetical protein
MAAIPLYKRGHRSESLSNLFAEGSTSTSLPSEQQLSRQAIRKTTFCSLIDAEPLGAFFRSVRLIGPLLIIPIEPIGTGASMAARI